MNRIRIGVIGLGKMGTYHMNLCEEINEIELVFVSDIDKKKIDKFNSIEKFKMFTNYIEGLPLVDAVIIATPTEFHYEIAKTCLLNNKHVLVEKPITTDFQNAEELFDIAESKKLILNIGHVERFNGAVLELRNIINNPYLIESRRVGPFEGKNGCNSIVLDLLIHDIDIILNIMKCNVIFIEATGSSIYSNISDVAVVHLVFENSTIANMLVSRVTQKKERSLSISQEDAYIFLDYTNQDINIYRKGQSMHIFGNRELKYMNEYTLERLFIYKENPLKQEIKFFVDCINGGKNRIVTIDHELMSLKVALEIDKIIANKNKKVKISL
jgi:predicted dehydrogenase